MRPCAQASFAALKASAGGSYILITSPAGIEGSGDRAIYGAVKAAQRGFAKSLAREWGPHGIRVNLIGPVAMSPAMEKAYAANPELETCPQGTFARAERIGRDVATAAVASLSSESAATDDDPPIGSRRVPLASRAKGRSRDPQTPARPCACAAIYGARCSSSTRRR